MATTSLAHVNRHSVAQAIAQARRDCANSIRWLNAVNKAALELEVGGWQFDGATLRMPSAINPSVRYTVNEHGCTCTAGAHHKPCKHKAAWRLLIKASELAVSTKVETHRRRSAEDMAVSPIGETHQRPRRSAEARERIAREASEIT